MLKAVLPPAAIPAYPRLCCPRQPPLASINKFRELYVVASYRQPPSPFSRLVRLLFSLYVRTGRGWDRHGLARAFRRKTNWTRWARRLAAAATRAACGAARGRRAVRACAALVARFAQLLAPRTAGAVGAAGSHAVLPGGASPCLRTGGSLYADIWAQQTAARVIYSANNILTSYACLCCLPSCAFAKSAGGDGGATHLPTYPTWRTYILPHPSPSSTPLCLCCSLEPAMAFFLPFPYSLPLLPLL